MSALIPYTEAAAEWVERTGEEAWVAAIWLPDAYDTCDKCVAREEHSHPNKEFITREELEEAVESKLQSDYETLNDL